jgi:hypothetical protein
MGLPEPALLVVAERGKAVAVDLGHVRNLGVFDPRFNHGSVAPGCESMLVGRIAAVAGATSK